MKKLRQGTVYLPEVMRFEAVSLICKRRAFLEAFSKHLSSAHSAPEND